MKKIFTLLAAGFLAFGSFAQDDDFKKFRFGLKLDPSLNWLTPDNKKKFESNGVAAGFGFGLQTEFALKSNISFCVGAGMSFEGGKMNFYPGTSADSTYFILNGDEELQSWDDAASLTTAGNSVYSLNNRRYKVNYVYIPVALKMKTKEIGMMTYFGQFGLDIKIKTRARANDNAKTILTGNSSDFTDINIDSGVQPLNLGINIGGGSEFNLSGTTRLFASVSYVYGLTNVLKKNDNTLAKQTGLATFDSIEQKAAQHGVRLSLGILF